MSVLLRLFAGLLLWALAFSAVYGLQGLGCALGWQRLGLGPYDVLSALLVVAWLAFLGGALLLARRGAARRAAQGEDAGIVDRLEYGIAVVGAVAIAYTLFPVFVTTPCGS